MCLANFRSAGRLEFGFATGVGGLACRWRRARVEWPGRGELPEQPMRAALLELVRIGGSCRPFGRVPCREFLDIVGGPAWAVLGFRLTAQSTILGGHSRSAESGSQHCLRWGRIEQGVTPRGQSSKINGLRRGQRPDSPRRAGPPQRWSGRGSRRRALRAFISRFRMIRYHPRHPACGSISAPAPAGEVPLLSGKPRDDDRTLLFPESDHGSHGCFGGMAMHMGT